MTSNSTLVCLSVKMLDTFLKCVGVRGRDKMGDRTKGRSPWRRWTRRKRNAENFAERVISVGKKVTISAEDEESQTLFVGNDIKTSKYTVLSFLPR